jgi:hypothetical protein
MFGMKALLAVALALLGAGSSSTYVTVRAEFVPPSKPGGGAHVAVTLTPRDPDVRVNEAPGPRLKLADGEAVLLDKQPAPPRFTAYDPENARYLDPALPVHLPVALKPGAPRGRQTVKAKVTYFYCSRREGWCRKGTEDVEFPVEVR